MSPDEVIPLLTDEERQSLHSAGANILARLTDPENPETKTTAASNELNCFLQSHPVLKPERETLLHYLITEYADVFDPST